MDNEGLKFLFGTIPQRSKMMHKFKKGDLVLVKIGERKVEMRVVDLIEGLLYKLDWTLCGYNPLLNTVRIPEKSLIEKIS